MTIPYNAEYELILAGAAGTSSTGSQGGNGYVLSTNVWLSKGQTVRCTVGGYGVSSHCSVGNTWQATAGAGGNVHKHVHNVSCYITEPCPSPTMGGSGEDGAHVIIHGSPGLGWEENECLVCGTRWRCDWGDSSCCPNTAWTHLVCGLDDSPVVGDPQPCSWRSGLVVTQELTNAGTGYFIIRLAERQNMLYRNVTSRYLSYNDVPCYLVILDDTVVYYKRR